MSDPRLPLDMPCGSDEPVAEQAQGRAAFAAAGGPRAAGGRFGDPERASVRAGFACMESTALAERHVAFALAHVDTTKARAAMSKVIEALIRTGRGQAAVCYNLTGGFDTQKARPEQLEHAWLNLKGTIEDTLPGAMAAVAAARKEKLKDAAYQDALLEAERRLAEARDRMGRVDASLDYTDPTPFPLKPGQTIGPVIGPHGDAIRTQYHLFFAGHYWREGVYEAANGTISPERGLLSIYRTAPLKYAQTFSESFYAYAEGVRQIDAAAARAAGVIPTNDAFCSILNAGGLLWDARGLGQGFGVPEQFFQWFRALSTLGMAITNPASGSSPQTVAFHLSNLRVADAWAHAGAAVGSIFAFMNSPQKERCAQ